MQALDQPNKAFNTIWEGSSERRRAAYSPMSYKGTKARRDTETRNKGEFVNRTNAMHSYQPLIAMRRTRPRLIPNSNRIINDRDAARVKALAIFFRDSSTHLELALNAFIFSSKVPEEQGLALELFFEKANIQCLVTAAWISSSSALFHIYLLLK